MTPSAAGIALIVLWLAAALLACVVVRDLFSPDKLLLVACGLFFADIFFAPFSAPVYVAYALLLVACMAGIASFARQAPEVARLPRARPPAAQVPGTSGRHHLFFWMLSLPALWAQATMISIFGGITEYINVLALRVVEFQGYGWLTSIIQSFSVINLIYFAWLVTGPRRGRPHLLPYLVHLLIFMLLALLTGSRGALLVNFVLMVMVWHHAVRAVKLRTLLAVAVCALLAASVLEVAREGVAVGDEGLITGISEEREPTNKLSFQWASYGTIPLELVLDAPFVNQHYGLTYFTALTNFVPRGIWPGKPDTGGTILTREYTGDAWGGTSYLSTGILPEAVINFGPSAGLVFGALQMALLMGWLLRYYARSKRRLAAPGDQRLTSAVRLAYVSWGFMALVVGEFTNIVITLLIQLASAAIVFQLMRWSSLLRDRRPPAPAAPTASAAPVLEPHTS